MGTNAIEGIKLDLPEQKTLYLSSKAFKKMKRLRLLIFRNVVLSTTIEYLPTELRFIDWPGYPFPTLSLNPGPKQLVILNMPNSQIHQLGEAFKILPSSLHSKYLGTLNLTSCFSIEKFPNINIEMEFLYKLCLSGTAIKELPSSIDKLVRLKFLDLAFCEKLDRIPNSIYSLHQLEFFDLHGCLNLFKFPKNMSFSNRKEWLLVDPDDSLNLPFQKLKSLILENCNLLEADFLLAPNGFDNLERLLLGGNKFVSLPSFERFHQLHRLLLDNCESLTKIPELPGNLMLLDASDCKSLLDTNDNLMDKIKRNKGANAIEGIKLVFPKQKTLYLSSQAFKKMKRLRLLIFRNVILSTPIKFLPTELRFVDWPGYLPTLPLNHGPKQLVRLNMPNSPIQQLGEGLKMPLTPKGVKLAMLAGSALVRPAMSIKANTKICMMLVTELRRVHRYRLKWRPPP
ncbi:hypothetical protein FEM48_Zijuj05G0164800 [Ziziphus jujuba var. spinosa]|uniref:Disease resistance protein RPS4B/Roq1-like leucine-rich repeats domain-containing protein n=1 Tax=Ziziphus jujuba var. spinosa TaxID=714518 RepID=A0A978VFW3_ZIZJJ|nr:hypothetical protein FEM48_Zijuj05G0164800 [Ziziphus jujuba var. spinosa]